MAASSVDVAPPGASAKAHLPGMPPPVVVPPPTQEDVDRWDTTQHTPAYFRALHALEHLEGHEVARQQAKENAKDDDRDDGYFPMTLLEGDENAQSTGKAKAKVYASNLYRINDTLEGKGEEFQILVDDSDAAVDTHVPLPASSERRPSRMAVGVDLGSPMLEPSDEAAKRASHVSWATGEGDDGTADIEAALSESQVSLPPDALSRSVSIASPLSMRGIKTKEDEPPQQQPMYSPRPMKSVELTHAERSYIYRKELAGLFNAVQKVCAVQAKEGNLHAVQAAEEEKRLAVSQRGGKPKGKKAAAAEAAALERQKSGGLNKDVLEYLVEPAVSSAVRQGTEVAYVSSGWVVRAKLMETILDGRFDLYHVALIVDALKTARKELDVTRYTLYRCQELLVSERRKVDALRTREQVAVSKSRYRRLQLVQIADYIHQAMSKKAADEVARVQAAADAAGGDTVASVEPSPAKEMGVVAVNAEEWKEIGGFIEALRSGNPELISAELSRGVMHEQIINDLAWERRVGQTEMAARRKMERYEQLAMEAEDLLSVAQQSFTLGTDVTVNVMSVLRALGQLRQPRAGLDDATVELLHNIAPAVGPVVTPKQDKAIQCEPADDPQKAKERLEEQLRSLAEDLDSERATSRNLRRENNLLSKEVKDATLKVRDLNAELQEAQRRLGDMKVLEGVIKAKEEEIMALELNIKGLETDLKNSSDKIAELAEDAEKANEEAARAVRELYETKEEVRTLEDRVKEGARTMERMKATHAADITRVREETRVQVEEEIRIRNYKETTERYVPAMTPRKMLDGGAMTDPVVFQGDIKTFSRAVSAVDWPRSVAGSRRASAVASTMTSPTESSSSSSDTATDSGADSPKATKPTPKTRRKPAPKNRSVSRVSILDPGTPPDRPDSSGTTTLGDVLAQRLQPRMETPPSFSRRPSMTADELYAKMDEDHARFLTTVARNSLALSQQAEAREREQIREAAELHFRGMRKILKSYKALEALIAEMAAKLPKKPQTSPAVQTFQASELLGAKGAGDISSMHLGVVPGITTTMKKKRAKVAARASRGRASVEPDDGGGHSRPASPISATSPVSPFVVGGRPAEPAKKKPTGAAHRDESDNEPRSPLVTAPSQRGNQAVSPNPPRSPDTTSYALSVPAGQQQQQQQARPRYVPPATKKGGAKVQPFGAASDVPTTHHENPANRITYNRHGGQLPQPASVPDHSTGLGSPYVGSPAQPASALGRPQQLPGPTFEAALAGGGGAAAQATQADATASAAAADGTAHALGQPPHALVHAASPAELQRLASPGAPAGEVLRGGDGAHPSQLPTHVPQQGGLLDAARYVDGVPSQHHTPLSPLSPGIAGAQSPLTPAGVAGAGGVHPDGSLVVAGGTPASHRSHPGQPGFDPTSPGVLSDGAGTAYPAGAELTPLGSPPDAGGFPAAADGAHPSTERQQLRDDHEGRPGAPAPGQHRAMGAGGPAGGLAVGQHGGYPPGGQRAHRGMRGRHRGPAGVASLTPSGALSSGSESPVGSDPGAAAASWHWKGTPSPTHGRPSTPKGVLQRSPSRAEGFEGDAFVGSVVGTARTPSPAASPHSQPSGPGYTPPATFRSGGGQSRMSTTPRAGAISSPQPGALAGRVGQGTQPLELMGGNASMSLSGGLPQIAEGGGSVTQAQQGGAAPVGPGIAPAAAGAAGMPPQQGGLGAGPSGVPMGAGTAGPLDGSGFSTAAPGHATGVVQSGGGIARTGSMSITQIGGGLPAAPASPPPGQAVDPTSAVGGWPPPPELHTQELQLETTSPPGAVVQPAEKKASVVVLPPLKSKSRPPGLGVSSLGEPPGEEEMQLSPNSALQALAQGKMNLLELESAIEKAHDRVEWFIKAAVEEDRASGQGGKSRAVIASEQKLKQGRAQVLRLLATHPFDLEFQLATVLGVAQREAANWAKRRQQLHAKAAAAQGRGTFGMMTAADQPTDGRPLLETLKEARGEPKGIHAFGSLEAGYETTSLASRSYHKPEGYTAPAGVGAAGGPAPRDTEPLSARPAVTPDTRTQAEIAQRRAKIDKLTKRRVSGPNPNASPVVTQGKFKKAPPRAVDLGIGT